MSVHDGHRERLKARYLEHGLDNFNDINVLELLLFYAIPRADTNLIAHELLNRFGSLSGVLEASIQELQNVSGIGENSALLLSLIPQVSRRYMIDKTKPQKKINSASAAGKYFMPIFMYERDEVLYMLCLDSQKCVICCQLISRGVVNSVEANVRKMTELALRFKASSVIISHNHPRGTVKPRARTISSQRIFHVRSARSASRSTTISSSAETAFHHITNPACSARRLGKYTVM